MFLDIEEELEPFYYPKMLKMINVNETFDLIYRVIQPKWTFLDPTYFLHTCTNLKTI